MQIANLRIKPHAKSVQHSVGETRVRMTIKTLRCSVICIQDRNLEEDDVL